MSAEVGERLRALQAELRVCPVPRAALRPRMAALRFRESEGGGIVAEFTVRLKPGMRKCISKICEEENLQPSVFYHW